MCPLGYGRKMVTPRTYYTRRGDRVSGPFTGTQLHEMVASGALCETDEVRAADREKWHVARTVKGLSFDGTPSAARAPAVPVAEARSVADLAEASLAKPAIDMRAFERGRKDRTAGRWKRVLVWGGITAGAAITVLAIALAPLRQQGESELNVEDAVIESTVAPNRSDDVPNINAPNSASDPAKPSGLGWSLARIELEWGESRNWYWLTKDETDGRITYMAANREIPGVMYMVTGPPANVTGFTFLIQIDEDEAEEDFFQGLVACGTLTMFSPWDAKTIGAWVTEHWVAGECPIEGYSLQRGYHRLWMNGLGYVEDGVTGVLLMVGVSIAEEPAWTDWSPKAAEPDANDAVPSSYTVLRDEAVYDTPIRAQIEMDLIIGSDLSREQILALLHEKYAEASSRRVFEHLEYANSIWIRAYASVEYAKSSFLRPVAAIEKAPAHEEPRISFDEELYRELSRSPEVRYGLSEDVRRKIFMEALRANMLAYDEADEEFSTDPDHVLSDGDTIVLTSPLVLMSENNARDWLKRGGGATDLPVGTRVEVLAVVHLENDEAWAQVGAYPPGQSTGYSGWVRAYGLGLQHPFLADDALWHQRYEQMSDVAKRREAEYLSDIQKKYGVSAEVIQAIKEEGDQRMWPWPEETRR